MKQTETVRIGVDLGGTKTEAVALALSGDSFEVLARLRRPTRRDLGYAHMVESTCALIDETTKAAGLSPQTPVGIGMPGNVVRKTGLVKNANTTCLNGRPFRADLSARLDRRVGFGNDANCFALAESRFGAGRGHGVVFGVILGTGVGGGLVFPGPLPRLWEGPQGLGGEWGHVSLQPQDGPACYCGQRGCVETYLSGPAIEAHFFAQTHSKLSLPEIVARAEIDKDPDAQSALAWHSGWFGRAIAIVVNIVDPDVIVLGGGVSNLAGLYETGVREATRWVFGGELTTPIVKHTLGDSAGVIGAALLSVS